ncbi:MAG: DUF692 family protein [Deltaproteobacteria bacterium]|nr:DUF692 family protein [Deltaproteobacteria bacterium]
MNRFGSPDLGLGLGLRAQHAHEILRTRPPLGFLELLTENHLDVPPRAAALTEQLAAAYPAVLHGVSMNLGSVDALDRTHLRKVRELAERTRARWISDHLCWTGVASVNSHELLPLPCTDEALRHVAARVREVQPEVRIDTHGAEIHDDVWALFNQVVRRFPHAHVMLERDDAIPELPQLIGELDRAREIWHEANTPESRVQPRARRAHRIRLGSLAAPTGAWAAQQRDFWQRAVEKPLRFDHATPGLTALLDAQCPVSAARGLRVYSDAYTTNLRAALAANFPTLARVLTPRDFTALADEYAAAHPPSTHDYARHGRALAGFIEGFALADSYAIPREALLSRATRAGPARGAGSSRRAARPRSACALRARAGALARRTLPPGSIAARRALQPRCGALRACGRSRREAAAAEALAR